MPYADKERQREAARERKRRQRERQRDELKLVGRADCGMERDDLWCVSDGVYVRRATGELVPPLADPDCDWKTVKRKAVAVRDLYKVLGRQDKMDKLGVCASRLDFFENEDGSKKALQWMNACQDRLCPVCSHRRAHRAAARLARILDAVKEEHQGIQSLFLTLTVRNCDGKDLRATLDLLTKAWSKLTRRKAFIKAVRGWFRAIEITYNPETKTFHPHIHVILIVKVAYFPKENGLYIRKCFNPKTDKPDDKGPFWVTLWRESLQVDYDPSIDISKTYVKKGWKGDTNAANDQAVFEAAKYATKDSDFLNPAMPKDEAAWVLGVYTDALVRKRMTAMGGWVLDASDRLDADPEDVTDLVHGDEDGAAILDSETAEYIAVYGWRFRYANYFLRDKYANPDYGGRQREQEDTT